ncbi:hypothetical protein Pla110_20760 [Polystyrenella longa]|uniref:PsbP C-terminal domain-containing protein n=1 Tax=Polystyrenella longa TaxID=2528007 RepID=A0A518CM89_9PLAN|nr:hypothetical protein [Polystyrenella longa]QDU80349.1 hypothetical protein Pla110_20760 [Polystyrenella longa]
MTRRKKRILGCSATVLLSGTILWIGLTGINRVNQSEIGTGEVVPTTLPDEANRVTHSDGFSMISPPGWEVSITESSDTVRMMDLRVSKNYSKQNSSIVIESRPVISNDRVAQPAGTEEINFNNHKAYWRQKLSQQVSSGTLMFTENGYHWDITIYHRDKYGIQKDEMPEFFWEYLNTFRSNPVKTQ